MRKVKTFFNSCTVVRPQSESMCWKLALKIFWADKASETNIQNISFLGETMPLTCLSEKGNVHKLSLGVIIVEEMSMML